MTGTIPEKQTVVRLMERPVGKVIPGVNLVVTKDVAVERATQPGEVLVKVYWISLDPAMRGWMSSRKSYIAPVELGGVMRAGAIGTVVETKSEKYKVGDYVSGLLGIQEYALMRETDLQKTMSTPGLSPRLQLGVLGLNGLTAYFGLLNIGEPKPGETVLVSAAAGATGSIVAQIAKHVIGCRTVGIAGGPEKTAWLKDTLKLDDAIDYKAENMHEALKRTCPEGIDVYFDNVGGEILDEALGNLKYNARVVLCGAISTYNDVTPSKGITNYGSLIITSSKMQGMIVFNYAKDYSKAAKELTSWVQEGKIQYREAVVNGIENAPEAFLSLFDGKNFGKLTVDIGSPEQKEQNGSKANL